MSKKGVKKVAKIFSDMQELRVFLLSDIKDHENLRLGQMLEKGKDSMKGDFIKITAGKWK